MAVEGRPVVVGTDFSPGAAWAWQQAQELAGPLGAEVLLVHVAEGGAGAWQRNGEADAWLSGLGIDAGRLHVRHGSAWVELTRFAGDCEARLLVLGSHGRSGFQPLSLGSTAARVSVQAGSPVVVVSARVGGAGDRTGSKAGSRNGAANESRQAPGDTDKPTEVGTR